MNTPSQSQIAKLPLWAQEHIAVLERQRRSAIRALDNSLDAATPSAFFYNEFPCIGQDGPGPTKKTVYVQAPRQMHVVFDGVHLSITLRDRGIDLNWSDSSGLLREAAFIPTAHQSATIVSKERMAK